MTIANKRPTTTEILNIINNIRTIIPSLKNKQYAFGIVVTVESQEHDSKSIRVGDAIYYHRVYFSADHRRNI
jgi:hypothetical protein